MLPEDAGYSCGQGDKARSLGKLWFSELLLFISKHLGKISFPKCSLGPRAGGH